MSTSKLKAGILRYETCVYEVILHTFIFMLCAFWA